MLILCNSQCCVLKNRPSVQRNPWCRAPPGAGRAELHDLLAHPCCGSRHRTRGQEGRRLSIATLRKEDLSTESGSDGHRTIQPSKDKSSGQVRQPSGRWENGMPPSEHGGTHAEWIWSSSNLMPGALEPGGRAGRAPWPCTPAAPRWELMLPAPEPQLCRTGGAGPQGQGTVSREQERIPLHCKLPAARALGGIVSSGQEMMPGSRLAVVQGGRGEQVCPPRDLLSDNKQGTGGTALCLGEHSLGVG